MRFKRKLLDLVVVIFFVMASAATSIFFGLNFLLTTILFFGLPSAYLLYRKPNNLKKVTLISVILGLIWGFSFDYIAELNNAWAWGGNTGLFFPVTFFDVVSLDILIWYFLWIFSVISFYEYFVEYDNSAKISKNALPIAVTGVLVAAMVVLLGTFTNILLFEHTYFWLGAVTLIPYTYIVMRKPKLFVKSLMVAPYFFYLFLVFELTALYADLWSFSGHYIGMVNIVGLAFPFEEFFFWIMLSAAVTAAYYEHTVDNLD